MSRFLAFSLLLLAGGLEATPSFAHAFLDKATPGVGATVQTAPSVISLSFSEAVEPRFCGVTMSDGTGKEVQLGKPTAGSGATTLSVAVQGKLSPGAYKVTWHAVAVDTHRTQGTFLFTLAP